MLDNEPTTEAAETATAQSTSRAAKKTAAKKTVAKKTTVKKTAAPRKRVAKTAAAEVPTQSDDVTADPAPRTAKKAVAKKAAAKKAPAKKAATPVKRAAKKAAEPVETSVVDAGPVTETPAPAKKTTARKRTTKKAAATLVATDSPLTDGPVADAEQAPARRTRSRRGAEPTAEAAPVETAPAPARPTTFTGTSRVVSSSDAPAATTDSAATGDSAAATADSGRTATKRTSRRRGGQSAADAPAAEATPLFPTADATPAEADAPVADEATTGTRRSRRRAPAAAAVLFQAPTVPSNAPAEAAATSPVEATDPAPTTRSSRSRRGAKTAQAEPTVEAAPVAESADAAPADDEQSTTSRRRRSRRGRDAEAREEVVEPIVEELEDDEEDETAETEADEATDDQADDVQAEDGDDDESAEGTRRRRRRRGGRRRRKTGDAEDSSDEHDESADQDSDDAEASADDEQDGSADDGEDGGSSSRRRRRRRRRKGEEGNGAADDPDETVVRVREPRSKNTANEVTAIEGSTRLEAKKQRRREGRAAGRRRAPIVTEAEFLARRESVERTMVIRSREDLTQIAVSEDNVLVEHYVTTADQSSLIGNVYLGRVQNVLPSMEAAFIDIGKGRNAVLYAGEVDWATLGGSNGPRKIEQVLKSGQAVLVQVTKDPIGHKGARLTNQISLPGRYVVYVPRGGNGGISRKLPDTERNRLKTILKDIIPDEAGVIVRTAAEGASEEELTSDVSRLQSYWTEIDKKSKSGQAPALLHGEPDLLIRVVRDLFTEDFAKLVISGDDAYEQVKEYVAGVAPHLADRVEHWNAATSGDVFANYRIDEQIKKALDRKVWLPSGGSLVIDRTEAMTVVDVNTGKFTGSGGNLEETVTKNNLEAAEEIVRQLRLRDIGGIIVIDFIDMVLESNRDLVLRRLVECLGRDRTKHQVAEVTSLGLVQMTRKRIGTGLLEAFSENCDHCGGRGLILHDEPKESRRRDGGRNAGGNNAAGNGAASNGSGNGPDQSKPAAQAEETGRKSSRRRRGKGRSDEEGTETETAQHHADAAQRLAQIAAASAKKDAENGTPEPTGYPVSAEADEAVSPEATGFPSADVPADGAESADAGQNGTKSTRRRRSSRGRGKAAGEAAETPVELVSAGH
ncbi:Rne/Rng family ribonuclease [Kribbella sp. NPDC051587]|uniref:Rne/Rng family ribonuclease n=1 Tax=Kribbella sp. NPDC051587 TaxID=3364119 RepID=UPI0037BDBB84